MTVGAELREKRERRGNALDRSECKYLSKSINYLSNSIS
jgi:hypothetical protein